jgi:hypothetical protein
MKRNVFVLLLAVILQTMFVRVCRAEEFDCKIKAVSEFRNQSVYGWDDVTEEPILFVYEFPVFSGGEAAESCAAVYEKIGGDAKYYAREVVRKKSQYTYEDYLDELTDGDSDDTLFDITTCSVEYREKGVISIVQINYWYLGGVLSIGYTCHTFDTATGRELAATDVFKGSKSEILNKLQKEFAAEYGDLLDDPKEYIVFYLSEDGANYIPDNIFGFQRGSVLTIPYSRTDFIKTPFASQ